MLCLARDGLPSTLVRACRQLPWAPSPVGAMVAAAVGCDRPGGARTPTAAAAASRCEPAAASTGGYASLERPPTALAIANY